MIPQYSVHRDIQNVFSPTQSSVSAKDTAKSRSEDLLKKMQTDVVKDGIENELRDLFGDFDNSSVYRDNEILKNADDYDNILSPASQMSLDESKENTSSNVNSSHELLHEVSERRFILNDVF